MGGIDNLRVRFARGIARQDDPFSLYGIIDAESCSRRGLDLLGVATALAQGGVRLVQYRDKLSAETEYLANARALRKQLPRPTLLLLNDYPHLVSAADADGVHVGQTDCSVVVAREVVGPERIVGVSTHSADQALAANATDADYIAIGPVFATSSKMDAEPVVGVCGVQAARAVTTKPLVAIGGIGLDEARVVRKAGADSVAVISALLPSADLQAVAERAQDFLARLK